MLIIVASFKGGFKEAMTGIFYNATLQEGLVNG